MCSEKYIKNICQWGKKIKNAVIQREKKLALFVLCHLTFKANVNLFKNVYIFVLENTKKYQVRKVFFFIAREICCYFKKVTFGQELSNDLNSGFNV